MNSPQGTCWSCSPKSQDQDLIIYIGPHIFPFPQVLCAWLCAQLCNEKTGDRSPGKRLDSHSSGGNSHLMWIQGAELELGTLRRGRELMGGLWGRFLERKSRALNWFSPAVPWRCGWKKHRNLPLSWLGNSRYAYPGGLFCLCTAVKYWA